MSLTFFKNERIFHFINRLKLDRRLPISLKFNSLLIILYFTKILLYLSVYLYYHRLHLNDIYLIKKLVVSSKTFNSEQLYIIKNKCSRETTFSLFHEIREACSSILLDRVFSNFIRCESWFPICRTLAEAALLRGVCLALKEVGEILLGMELDRSRFVSILSFWRVRLCAGWGESPDTRTWGGNDDEMHREETTQMNHKTIVGSSANYPLKKPIRESMISSFCSMEKL